MLPADAKQRKDIPIFSGFVKYFPDAMAAVAQLSFICNEQHNPGEALHWAKDKSSDERDAQMRHIVDPVTTGGEDRDSEGVLHDVKNAWRAMANLQRQADAGVNIFAESLSDKQEPYRGQLGWLAPIVVAADLEVKADDGAALYGDEENQPHAVRFFKAEADGSVTVIYKGPFPDWWSAKEYAHKNPHNIAGQKTIHTLNRP